MRARWHRERLRRHWANLSRRPGRARICAQIAIASARWQLIGWGAPGIHGELLKLEVDVCEATVSRYMPRRPLEPYQLARWIAFLRNRNEAIAAMDFFTLPTLSLRVLYGPFIIEHGQRRIGHFNATYNPTAEWVIQQLREAFPFDTAPAHPIFDRDAIFSAVVVRFVQALRANSRRIAYRSPWQNRVAERWIGSCRREFLDHVVVFDQVRLLRTDASDYHIDRCHRGLGKDSPSGRQVTPRPSQSATVVALPRVGALQHRYVWREAA